MVCLLAAKACDEQMATRLIAVAGFLAGSAMSAKYPGLLSVILPTGLFLLAACWQRTQAEGFRSSRPAYIFRNAAIFVVATSVAVGPWLIKNFSETGNPVYPLGYSVFGASDWNAEMDAKWKRAHSAPDHKLSAIHLHLEDVAIRSDGKAVFCLHLQYQQSFWPQHPIQYVGFGCTHSGCWPHGGRLRTASIDSGFR